MSSAREDHRLHDGITSFTHSVAVTNDDLQALIGAAEDFGPPGFVVPLSNTQFFRWCLAHGPHVFFVMNLMTIGLYQEPAGAYLASVGYWRSALGGPARSRDRGAGRSSVNAPFHFRGTARC